MSYPKRPARSVFLAGDETPEGETSLRLDLTIEEGSAEFLSDGAGRRKPSSQLFYAQRLRVLNQDCASRDIRLVRQLTPSVLREFRERRLSNGLSQGTVRHDEVAAKMLTAFCAGEGWLRSDPLYRYKPIPLRQKERKPATQAEIDLVIRAIEQSHSVTTSLGSHYKSRGERQFVKSRDRLIVLTLIETACRSGEILALTIGDLRRDQGVISINKSGMADTRKNGIAIEVPVQEYWWWELDTYLKTRPELRDDDLIFPLLTGGQMSSGQWAHRFKDYCNSAGTPGISSHCIRHAIASQHAETCGTFAAMRLTGQENAKSIERYTKQAGRESSWLKKMHSQASPLTTFAAQTGRLARIKKRHKVHK